MRRSQRGQTGTEYMLLVAVVVLAVVAAAWAYVPAFQAGTQELGSQVQASLRTGEDGRQGIAPACDGCGKPSTLPPSTFLGPATIPTTP